jgi:predicted Fe-Mo cluster-binding NifX family protein
MRLAISAEDNNGLDSTVSHHFGRCPYFVLVDMDGEEIQEVRVVDNPHYAHHQPGMVPSFINDQGAEVMISGGMGRRAIAFFEQYGIQPATGASGTARMALESFLNGTLSAAAPCRESIEHAHDLHKDHGEHDTHG